MIDNLIPQISPYVINEQNMLDTDHNIVVTKLLIDNIFGLRIEATDRHFVNKRYIFNYDLMDENLWEKYCKQLDLNIGELNIKYELTKQHNDAHDLNRS